MTYLVRQYLPPILRAQSAERAGGDSRPLSPTNTWTAQGAGKWRRENVMASVGCDPPRFHEPQRHLAASAAPGPIASNGSRPPAASPATLCRAVSGDTLKSPLITPGMPVSTSDSFPLPTPPAPPSPRPQRYPCREGRCAHGWDRKWNISASDTGAFSAAATASKRASGWKVSDIKSEIKDVPSEGTFFKHGDKLSIAKRTGEEYCLT